MTSSGAATANKHRGLAIILASLSAVGPFSIDGYLPSIPQIAQSLDVTQIAVQQTLTAFMLPFALMMLWHGAIADAIGRKRTIMWGLCLFTVASLACALCHSLQTLLFYRVMQGITAGAGMVAGRAIVRDVLEGAEAQRLMAHVTMVFAIAPTVAPIIGGWLQVWFGWRSIFYFLVIISSSVAFLSWRLLPETLPPEKRQPLHPGYLARSYWSVLMSGPFVTLCAATTLNFAGVFIYIMSAPVFVMKHLHLSETQFIWLFGPTTTGMVAGSWVSGRVAGRMTRVQPIWWGYGLMAFAASANVTINLLWPPSLPWSVVPIFFYVFGMSLSMPSLTLLALDLFPEQRGLAASCQMFAQTLGAALTAAVIAPLVWKTTLTLATGELVLLAMGFATFLVYLRIEKTAPVGAVTA